MREPAEAAIGTQGIGAILARLEEKIRASASPVNEAEQLAAIRAAAEAAWERWAKAAGIPSKLWSASFGTAWHTEAIVVTGRFCEELKSLVTVTGAGQGRCLVLMGPTGVGKAQTLSANVLTPHGFVPMGAIEIGDEVIAGDGTVTSVIGVFPQGQQEVYRVTFSDGSSTSCTFDHLWLTKSRWNDQWKVRALSVIGKSVYCGDGSKKYKIPIMGQAKLKSQDIPLDPYVLGVLLGDGCFRAPRAVRVSVADEDILCRLREQLPGAQFNYFKGVEYSITFPSRRPNPIYSALKQLGLLGLKSPDKFIPAEYLLNDVETRLELLRGLMDSDGSVEGDGSTPTFWTTSKRLLDGVVFLVRSLGGVVQVGHRDKPMYRYRGEKRTGKTIYRATFSLTNDVEPFRSERKRSRLVRRTKYPPRRYITGIQRVGFEETKCIQIEDNSGLYVTDDFIVTHNTYAVAALLRVFRGLDPQFWYFPALCGALLDREHGRDVLESVKNAWLLALDDFGAEYLKSGGLLDAFIDELFWHREGNGLPTILTTNLMPGELKDRISDRIADRLKGEWGWLRVIPGESLRYGQARQVEIRQHIPPAPLAAPDDLLGQP